MRNIDINYQTFRLYESVKKEETLPGEQININYPDIWGVVSHEEFN
ncbi:unnamed protein product [marine sediment metagenome]|uniref:Uncharacterized protein n=1 Tax=marine sediment metagenome TaxID=412755 RepID=X1HL36_9ZZZZ